MKEDKKEKTTENDKGIIILDKGITAIEDPAPQWICCAVPYIPMRW